MLECMIVWICLTLTVKLVEAECQWIQVIH